MLRDNLSEFDDPANYDDDGDDAGDDAGGEGSGDAGGAAPAKERPPWVRLDNKCLLARPCDDVVTG